MGLGTREVLLFLRAKDQASRLVNDVTRALENLGDNSISTGKKMVGMGSAVAGIGLAMTAVGAAGASFLYGATKSAIDFDKQARLTQTQLFGVSASLEDVKNIARRTALEIAVPFETLQPALYDIFSSMNVGLAEGEKLLKGFAKAAVAGDVSIQEAARATIAVINAYGDQFEGKYKDVNRVLDIQFELVRSGVGTYGEFASVLGRVIPSAVRVGQEFTTVSGGLAFLTRNGLSTAMASASLGRAFDALSKTRVQDRMREWGVETKTAGGEFRQMDAIMIDLGESMKDLTKPEKAAALEAIFKGAGGTIQARRFFDIAIENYKELNDLVTRMTNSSGALDMAFDIMRNAPANQIQALKNAWMVLREEIGNRFLPIIGLVTGYLIKAIDWFQGLGEGVKRTIIIFAAVSSGLLIVVGTLTAIGGAVAIVMGALMTITNLKFVALAARMGAVGLVIVGLAAALFIVIRYMDSFKDAWHALGQFMKTPLGELAKAGLLFGALFLSINRLLPLLLQLGLALKAQLGIGAAHQGVGLLVGLLKTMHSTVASAGKALIAAFTGTGGSIKSFISGIGSAITSIKNMQISGAVMGSVIAAGLAALITIIVMTRNEIDKAKEASRNIGDQWDKLSKSNPEKAYKRIGEEINSLRKEQNLYEKDAKRGWANVKRIITDTKNVIPDFVDANAAMADDVGERIKEMEKKQKELKVAYDDWVAANKVGAAAIVGDVESIQDAVVSMSEEARKEFDKVRQSVYESIVGFESLRSQSTKSLAELEATLIDNLKFMREFNANVTFLFKAGHEDLARELARMGPAAGQAAADAVAAVRSGKGLGALEDAIGEAGDVADVTAGLKMGQIADTIQSGGADAAAKFASAFKGGVDPLFPVASALGAALDVATRPRAVLVGEGEIWSAFGASGALADAMNLATQFRETKVGEGEIWSALGTAGMFGNAITAATSFHETRIGEGEIWNALGTAGSLGLALHNAAAFREVRVGRGEVVMAERESAALYNNLVNIGSRVWPVSIVGDFIVSGSSGDSVSHFGGLIRHAGGAIQKLHGGGSSGWSSDEVMVRALKGEFMMQRSAVNYYGENFMRAVNEKRLQPPVGGSKTELHLHGRFDSPMDYYSEIDWQMRFRGDG